MTLIHRDNEISSTVDMSVGDSTAASRMMPWRRSRTASTRRLPHLVLLWCRDAPERVGEVAALSTTTLLGRGAGDGNVARAEFTRQRPGRLDQVGPLRSRHVSRNQLRLTTVDSRCTRVENLGRCRMLVNGAPTQAGVLSAGDTLTLADEAVFLLEAREPLWEAIPLPPQYLFGFGEPDQCGIVGESASAWALRLRLLEAADSRAHVIIHGSSGSGKELVGHAIHQCSARAKRSLVSRNAATLPAGLLDAELFGTVKNYPNAGSAERPGLIGRADGGTLLLDEVGELPSALQAHLLRVLDSEGDYQMLGDCRVRRADLRVLALTNRDLSELKHDFLARFSMRVEVPALNDRLSDVPFLMRQIWRELASDQPSLMERFDRSTTGDGGWEPLTQPAVVDLLVRHCYHHNYRELERLLRLAASTSSARYIEATPELRAALNPASTRDHSELSREAIEQALAASGNNRSLAARHLGLRNRHMLYRLMRKLGM